jgi:hypothetical protein
MFCTFTLVNIIIIIIIIIIKVVGIKCLKTFVVSVKCVDTALILGLKRDILMLYQQCSTMTGALIYEFNPE